MRGDPQLSVTRRQKDATTRHCGLTGTATGISNELCGRCQKSDSDPHGLGRWSCIQLTAEGGKSLVIVTAHRVCEASVSATGASAACHQQWNIPRLNGMTKPKPPRKQFTTGLINQKVATQGRRCDTRRRLQRTARGHTRPISAPHDSMRPGRPMRHGPRNRRRAKHLQQRLETPRLRLCLTQHTDALHPE